MKTLKRALLSFLIILCPQVFAADYYTASGDPVSGSALSSSVIRAEYAAIAAGFAKIAPYTGAGSRVLFINTGATAQATDAELTYNATTNLLTVNTSTFGLNTSIAGTLGVTGVATLTAQPILSSLTASLPVFTDASKGLVSNTMTGTGNVVMSASPTLTGTIGAASMTLSGTLGVTGDTTLTGDLAVNGGDLTTTASTFNLLATPTTVNAFAGASVALNIGHASAAAAFPGGISIPTGKTLSGAGAINISGAITTSAKGTFGVAQESEVDIVVATATTVKALSGSNAHWLAIAQDPNAPTAYAIAIFTTNPAGDTATVHQIAQGGDFNGGWLASGLNAQLTSIIGGANCRASFLRIR